MSTPRTVALPDTYRSSAKKMLRVPRVTMNGGIRKRVMSQPLRRPHPVPNTKPRRRATGPGNPSVALTLAMMIDAKTAMAPTDRSTPAVRMMIVCPMASVPDHRHLPDDQGQVGGLQEPVGDDEAEGRHEHDQDDERTQGRIPVQRVLDPLERRQRPPVVLVDRCP